MHDPFLHLVRSQYEINLPSFGESKGSPNPQGIVSNGGRGRGGTDGGGRGKGRSGKEDGKGGTSAGFGKAWDWVTC